ncbi:MAG: phosphoribosylformylglycinamidine cyclo-ligase [Candidatus Rokubacteria bacterium]|nr:phosphoribosylformylglycinamidine cyclo-ligase [Candidatus Rokubacteria bacterium]
MRRRARARAEAPQRARRPRGVRLTYKAAGVDIRAGDEAVRRLAPLARQTYRPEVLGDIGAFAGFFRVPSTFREPVFVASTDGVGSKLKVAFLAGRHDTVGIDLVAMSVNDLLVHGAEPLIFLDYIGIGRLVPRLVEAVVRGIAAGCREAGCALIGGETAELPDFYADREYDLAGFAVGVVERAGLIDGRTVRPGDVLLGLGSTGPHSNGYSLVRKVVFERLGYRVTDRVPELGQPIGEALLTPTRIYVRPVLGLLRSGVPVHAMAHVTGGGLTGNLPRVLPPGCRAVVRRGAWAVPPIFGFLQEAGRIADAEMFRVFNMGVGFVLVVPPAAAARAREALEGHGVPTREIGEITRGSRGVTYA